MKKNTLLLLVLLTFVNITKGQVAVGKSTVEGSSILDFNETNNTRGIILPAVTTVPSPLLNGTIYFNREDAIVYMRQNGASVPMTEGNGNATGVIGNPSPEAGSGVIMGAATSSANGVLILESSNLSLTLPKVDRPHLNIKSPYPGTICYDTSSNTIAVFDGAYWNFWK